MESTRRRVQRHTFIIFFGVFGIVAILIYVLVSGSSTYTVVSDKTTSQNTTVIHALSDVTQYQSQIKNALIVVPDTTVRISLVDGRASYGTALDGGDVALVRLVGGVTLDEHTSHVFADIAVQSGGTGVFHYIALFEIIDGKITHTSSYFIGDRVTINAVSLVSGNAHSYVARVDYLTRESDQAMVDDPTVPQHIDITVQNALFVESGL